MELLEDAEGGRNVLFDRCPLDFLGYLLTHEESDAFDLEEWLARVRSTIQTLDLVVFVPIEEHDRIQLSAHKDPELRVEVDEKLGPRTPILSGVTGSQEHRLHQRQAPGRNELR
jgi:hypothetical protein